MNLNQGLQQTLSSLIVLSLATREAHWNIRGPEFLAAHKFLGDFYDAIDGFIDEVAETLAQEGGAPQAISGNEPRVDANRWSMDSSRDIGAAFEKLREGSLVVCDNLKPIINRAMIENENYIADMLTRLSAALYKNIWFMSASLSKSPAA